MLIKTEVNIHSPQSAGTDTLDRIICDSNIPTTCDTVYTFCVDKVTASRHVGSLVKIKLIMNKILNVDQMTVTSHTQRVCR